MMRSILDFSVKIIRQGGSDNVNQLHYKYINIIMTGTFRTIKNISLRDENFDKIVLFEILGIHSALCKSIPNFYINYINNNMIIHNNETAMGLMEKLVLTSNNKNLNVNDVSSLLNVTLVNKIKVLVLNQKQELKI